MNTRLLVPGAWSGAPAWQSALARLLGDAARHCLGSPLGILAPLLALPLLLLLA